MFIKKSIVCAMLAFVPVVLSGGVSSNMAVTTDYVFRGQSQTSHGAAVQGGLDLNLDMGLHFGTWLSNVGFGPFSGIEADYFGTYTYAFSDKISASVGGILYQYLLAPTTNTLEYNVGLSLWMFNISGNFAPNYGGTKSNSIYVSLSTSCPIIAEHGISLDLAVGNSSFGDEVKVGSKGYMDGKISLNHTNKDGFKVGIFYTDTNRKMIDAMKVETKAKDKSMGLMISKTFG